MIKISLALFHIVRVAVVLVSVPSPVVFAQVFIASGTTMSASPGTSITIHTADDLTNISNFDFGSARFSLTLNGVQQTITGNFKLSSLSIAGEGTKMFNGKFIVTEALDFNAGFIRVPATSLLVFSGEPDGLQVSGNSYVDGIFYQISGGQRTFPVGYGSTFAPLVFENLKTTSADTVGVQVIEGASGITPADFSDESIEEVANQHFWQITTNPSSAITAINSIVQLSMNGIEIPREHGVVLQKAGDIITNLGYKSGVRDEYIQSLRNVNGSVLAIGKSKEVIVTIYQLITPFGSEGTNDELTIENIESFENIKVRLLDRYGVLIKEWGNDFPEEVKRFDFTKLSPGNYICIAEYGNVGDDKMKQQSQMVTVLRSR